MDEQSLQSIILSNQSRDGISEGVRKAVEAANAGGLRPAYEPAFSQLRTLEKLANETADLNLQFHEALVNLLYLREQPATWLTQQAVNQLQRWEVENACDHLYITRWREWLSLPAEQGVAQILRDDNIGTSMRCNSPFVFLATNERS